MMKLFRGLRRRIRNTLKDLLNKTQEEPRVLQKAGTLTKNTQPAIQPTTKAPRRGVHRAVAKGFRAIVPRNCPCFYPKCTQEDAGVSIRVSPPMEDKNVPVSPSIKDIHISERPSMENIRGGSSSEDIFFSAASHILPLLPECREESSGDISTSLNSFHSAVSSFRGNIESKLSAPMSSSTTSHGTSPPAPSSSAMEDQPIVLSMESLNFHKILGEGSYGNVVLASHPAIDQKLAVKAVKKRRLIKDKVVTSAFTERDVMMAGRDCPYITRLYSTFQTKNHLVVSMEFVSGGDLSHLVDNFAPFNLTTIRDLKPANIFLDSFGRTKIGDFGLAVSGVTQHKRIMQPIGTLEYMAPEILQRMPFFTMADYFALGIIVYEMALARHPFSMKQGIYKYISDVIRKPPKLPWDLDSGLCDIIIRLLEKSQEMRMFMLRDIRGLPFFKTISWAEVDAGTSPPPFKPPRIAEDPLEGRIEVAEFMAPEDEDDPIQPEEQLNFQNFTITSEDLKLQPSSSPSSPSS